jgi:acyl carrier protein
VDQNTIYEHLTCILQEVFLNDDLVATPELSAKHVNGWDSFKMIEIIMAVEDRFDVQFSNKEVVGLQRVGDFVALIGNKLK